MDPKYIQAEEKFIFESMNIAIAQYDIDWESPASNRSKIEALVDAPKSEKCDLLVLPEMFTTGFSMNTEKNAETMDGPSIMWMQELAHKMQAVVTGSLIISEAGHYFNRLIWMRPDGTLDHYDKRHLFTLAKEDHHFTAGREKKIFQLEVGAESWRICPQICYDIRFPVFSRNVEAYDMLMYPANFPEKRTFAWSHLLIARAIENQCYVAGVNRTGTDGVGIPYSGQSVILSYDGSTVVGAGTKEGLFYANVEKRKLIAYRRAYDFLGDRDEFEIRLEI